MKAVYFFIVSVGIVMLSCKEKSLRSSSLDQRIDYISLENTKAPLWEKVDSVKYISLETNDISVMGEIRKLEMYKGKLFILDRNRHLMIFDTTGRFLCKVGEYGRGPEEYLSIMNFCLDKQKEQVIIVDARGSKMLYYDFAGNLVKNISAKGEFGNAMMGCILYKNSFFNYYNCSYRTIYSTVIYDKKDLKTQISLNPYPMNRCQATLWSDHPLVETEEGITFIKPLSDTLFQFDGNSVVPRFIVEHTLPLATSSVCNAYNPEALNNESYFDFVHYLDEHGYYGGFRTVYETRDYLLLEYISPSRLLCTILWNKNTKKGYSDDGSGSGDFDETKDVCRPLFGDIISSTDDAFITVSYEFDMDVYKRRKEKNYLLDPGMLKALDNWKEGDNPVISLVYLSQE